MTKLTSTPCRAPRRHLATFDPPHEACVCGWADFDQYYTLDTCSLHYWITSRTFLQYALTCSLAQIRKYCWQSVYLHTGDRNEHRDRKLNNRQMGLDELKGPQPKG